MSPPRPAQEETRESWYGVEDPRQRKQIQDRLAQRARRRRLAEAHTNHEQSLVVRPKYTKRLLQPAGTTEQESIKHPHTSSSISSSSSSTQILRTADLPRGYPPSPLDHKLLIDPKWGVLLALRENGHLMGLYCWGVKVITSRHQSPTVPKSLHPTPLQLTTPHFDWIDKWPFPRMRDNMILLAETIDLKQLYEDLFTRISFQMKEGVPTWDPSAWKIDSDFSARWGYLFY
ncbi:hypothetical protein PV11_08184 [Exophiala sideris]|uniref:Uncharacterized protein n=1 Tax=Exophiala sideris TaxID=1016849 RepID=A0A0D1VWN6_9EURO|nr:hypothetical protein PV11_08184 [Exophiala sideris]